MGGFDYYCPIGNADGKNRLFGAGIAVPKGGPPPADGADFTMVLNDPGAACSDHRCSGLFAPILTKLYDMLPSGWRPGVNPGLIRKQRERNEERRRRYKLVGGRVVRRNPLPNASGVVGCCLCGDTGGCWSSGVDCRLLPWKQRRLGQC
jgi:hypothetical protein